MGFAGTQWRSFCKILMDIKFWSVGPSSVDAVDSKRAWGGEWCGADPDSGDRLHADGLQLERHPRAPADRRRGAARHTHRYQRRHWALYSHHRGLVAGAASGGHCVHAAGHLL